CQADHRELRCQCYPSPIPKAVEGPPCDRLSGNDENIYPTQKQPITGVSRRHSIFPNMVTYGNSIRQAPEKKELIVSKIYTVSKYHHYSLPPHPCFLPVFFPRVLPIVTDRHGFGIW